MMNTRILQVTMLQVKFGRIKIRTYLLQGCDNIFGHFDNIFCHKVKKRDMTFQTKSPIAA